MGQECYLDICRQFSLQPVPASDETLAYFVGHMRRRGMALATARQYLAAVRRLHLQWGQPLPPGLPPYTDAAIHGYPQRLVQSPTRPRHALTVDPFQPPGRTLAARDASFAATARYFCCKTAPLSRAPQYLPPPLPQTACQALFTGRMPQGQVAIWSLSTHSPVSARRRPTTSLGPSMLDTRNLGVCPRHGTPIRGGGVWIAPTLGPAAAAGPAAAHIGSRPWIRGGGSSHPADSDPH